MKKLTLLFLLILAIIVASFKYQKEEKPNVLFIMVDDLRPELAAFGATHIQSPNIDKLASESALFQRAFCNVPVCGASRASLMSGVRPGRFRFLSAETRVSDHYPGVKSLPALLHDNGYTTISNGKIYHHDDDDKDAWTEVWRPKNNTPRDYVGENNVLLDNTIDKRGLPYEDVATDDMAYADGKIAEKAINDLKKLKKEGKPFFLAVGFLKPHLPFNAPKKYWDLYDFNKIGLPKNYSQPTTTPAQAFHNSGELRNYSGVPKVGFVSDSLARKLIHGYNACVSYTDAQIGKVLNELAASGLDEKTIVVLIGDHGWNLGDHKMWNKHCNFSSSLNTPLVLKIPKVTAGQRIDHVVEFIDIFPTIAELTHLKLPQTAAGESVLPLIKHKKRSKDFAISKWNNGLTLVKGQLYYTEWFDIDDKMVARMLFDHTKDPLENDNLAEKSEYAATVANMSKQLHANRGEDFNVDRRTEKGKK